MSISPEKFIELSDSEGIGVSIKWRINGIEYGFASFGKPGDVLSILRRCIRSMLATLCNGGEISSDEWKEFKIG